MAKQNTKDSKSSSSKRMIFRRTGASKPLQVSERSNERPRRGREENAAAKRENNTQQRRRSSQKKQEPVRKTPVRIIPLGGLNEIGKNFNAIECSNDLFVLDCGLAFPDDDMPGVDIVIPDFSYIEKNIDKLRGVVLTHGHEDHIGGLPYFLKKFNVPVYGTRLTIGLVEGKLKEHAGVLVHTGDFKVDYTPIEGGIIDLPRFAELGNKGVLALMADSTNAERPGFTMS